MSKNTDDDLFKSGTLCDSVRLVIKEVTHTMEVRVPCSLMAR
jgi:hypothetical protein